MRSEIKKVCLEFHKLILIRTEIKARDEGKQKKNSIEIEVVERSIKQKSKLNKKKILNFIFKRYFSLL